MYNIRIFFYKVLYALQVFLGYAFAFALGAATMFGFVLYAYLHGMLK
jgi:hypothetical protein